MTATGPALAGAVLCGGLSSRMGRDKAALELDGVSLLERVVERLGAVADPLLLATGALGHAHPRCSSVPDPVAGRGPVAGLVAALSSTPHHLCAVVAVDMPDVEPDLLARLAACWDGEDAVLPLGPRGPEPLHAVYARSALTVAEAALACGDVSLRSLLDRLRVRHIVAAQVIGPAAAARFAANLNRPQDLTAWRRAAAPRPPRRPR